MKRFSVWLYCDDREKLESMAKVQGLKASYLIRKAVKEYVQNNYPKIMAKVIADTELQEENTKEVKVTSQQKQTLRVGLKARTQIRERKAQDRRMNFPK